MKKKKFDKIYRILWELCIYKKLADDKLSQSNPSFKSKTINYEKKINGVIFSVLGMLWIQPLNVQKMPLAPNKHLQI